MPGVAGKNPIAAKLAKKGLNKASAKHNADETNFGGGGEFSANVSGVCQVVDAKFGEYKPGTAMAGEPYLMIRVVGHTPDSESGKSTNVMVPLCDDPKSYSQPKTFDENVAVGLNELRKCGATTEGVESVDDWQALMDGLVETKPFVRYHTYETKPRDKKQKPRVKFQIDRPAEDYVSDGDPGSAIQDETGGGSTESEVDWDEVATNAEGGDVDAQQQLKDACTEIGVDADELATWQEAADKIKEGGSGEGGDSEQAAEEPDEPAIPEKDETVKFKPPGARKSVEATITAVFEGKKTVNLKTDDGKTFKAISWDKLER